jgi:hypothetical protein
MIISKYKGEERIPESLEKSILEFLQQNEGKAFTVSEIMTELGIFKAISSTLEMLAKKGKVEQNQIKLRSEYYNYYRAI